jgi:hypothetical protein
MPGFMWGCCGVALRAVVPVALSWSEAHFPVRTSVGLGFPGASTNNDNHLFFTLLANDEGGEGTIGPKE